MAEKPPPGVENRAALDKVIQRLQASKDSSALRQEINAGLHQSVRGVENVSHDAKTPPSTPYLPRDDVTYRARGRSLGQESGRAPNPGYSSGVNTAHAEQMAKANTYQQKRGYDGVKDTEARQKEEKSKAQAQQKKQERDHDHDR